MGTRSLDQARREAIRRLEDLIDPECEDCLASTAVHAEDSPDWRGPDARTLMTHSFAPWNPAEAIMIASGSPADDRPCKLCQDAQHQEDMVLCDRCNDCYHPDCARDSGGS